VAAQVQRHLRLFAYAIPALLIACAITLGAATTASSAPVVTAAEDGIDGICDPFNDIDDPDCWDDEGETEDEIDPGWDDDPDYIPPAEDPAAPIAPNEPPEWTPPTVKWPAPPKGAYAKLRANNRTAVAPKGAPKPIKAMIRAANSITRKPYKWGGGHGRWYDSGYDCSGATSFILRAGGYVNTSMVSGTFAKWGKRGAGNWIRIYANKSHVFMVIAGLRFDTSAYGFGGKGPRWRGTVRPTGGFALRHPAGL
jgi:hypothetical protein